MSASMSVPLVDDSIPFGPKVGDRHIYSVYSALQPANVADSDSLQL